VTQAYNARRTDNQGHHFRHCRMSLTLAQVRTKTSLSSETPLPSYARIFLAVTNLCFVKIERTISSRACIPIPTRSETGCSSAGSWIERLIMSVALNNKGMPSRKWDCVPSFNESRMMRPTSSRSFFLSR